MSTFILLNNDEFNNHPDVIKFESQELPSKEDTIKAYLVRDKILMEHHHQFSSIKDKIILKLEKNYKELLSKEDDLEKIYNILSLAELEYLGW